MAAVATKIKSNSIQQEKNLSSIKIYPQHRGSGVYPIQQAWSAIRADGSVISWGREDLGGNSQSVSQELSSGVARLFSTNSSFAALKDDGSVIAWGDLEGGVNAQRHSLLSGVINIFSTGAAYAALKEDGSVVTWGSLDYGGDSSAIAEKLRSDVKDIFSSTHSFAALKNDGSVVAWASPGFGDILNAHDVASSLKSGAVKIFSTSTDCYAALKRNGSVVTWSVWPSDTYNSDHYDHMAWNSIFVQKYLKNVKDIQSTYDAFAALRADGSVITWGNQYCGGDSSMVSAMLDSNVKEIFSNRDSFAALKKDGSVVTWGNPAHGGDSSYVASDLKTGVKKIVSTTESFAALKSDGSVVTWGSQDANWGGVGGFSGYISDKIKSNVIDIVGSYCAYAALKADGSVVTWGFGYAGTELKLIALPNNILDSGVFRIYSNAGLDFGLNEFTALKTDGTVVSWRGEGSSQNNYFIYKPDANNPPVVEIQDSQAAGMLYSFDSSTLTKGYDTLWLKGNDSINGTGNSIDNYLVGNPGNNILDGGAGNDVLAGVKGNDTYIVDSINDRIIEIPDEGVDIVKSSVNWTLGKNLEDLTLTGKENLSGTGNEHDNLIIGNGAKNVLDGGAGNDTLDGLGGVDILTGGLGGDIFRFSTKPKFGESTADHITDFNASEGDGIEISASLLGLSTGPTVRLGLSVTTITASFQLNAALIMANTFVYDSSNGNLYWNSNGTKSGFGTGGIFAVLDNRSTLSASNISLI